MDETQQYCSGKMIGWSFLAIRGDNAPPLHPLYRLLNHNGFSCVYMTILTSQTDIKITQATPLFRPGERGLRSKLGWRGAGKKGVSSIRTLLMSRRGISWAFFRRQQLLTFHQSYNKFVKPSRWIFDNMSCFPEFLSYTRWWQTGN